MRPGPGAPDRYHELSERDVRQRELSQNLLRGRAAAEEFLDRVDLGPDDLCVEVGAGDGVITEPLARMCGEVVAYELDDRLAERLKDRLRNAPNVHILVGDFLDAWPPTVPFQLVGNVPFSITSAIVDWGLNAEQMMATTIITQLEYAKKRTGAYGRWSLVTVSSWPTFRWELRGVISRTQFRPVPRVDAGVLHIERRPELLISPGSYPRYLRMVELAFGGVGGSVHASLRRLYSTPVLDAAFSAARIDRSVVVAFVHPDQWIDLHNALESRGRGSRRDHRDGSSRRQQGGRSGSTRRRRS